MSEGNNPDSGAASYGLDSAANAIAGLMGSETTPPKKREDAPEANAAPDNEPTDESQEGDEGEAPQQTDPDEGQEPEPEQPNEPQRYKIKTATGEESVTLEELEKGYLRQADYTRKTQEAASKAKEAQAVAENAARERQTYAERLELIAQQIPQPVPPSVDLLNTDPVEYLRQKAAYDDQAARKWAVESERQRINQMQQAEMQKAEASRLATERELLTEAIPEWKDQTKRTDGIKNLTNYLRKEGFDENRIRALNYADHRMVVQAHKAMLYDQLQSKKPAVENKVRTAPLVMKPGTARQGDSKTERYRESMSKLSRSGRVEDAAGAILAMMKK